VSARKWAESENCPVSAASTSPESMTFRWVDVRRGLVGAWEVAFRSVRAQLDRRGVVNEVLFQSSLSGAFRVRGCRVGMLTREDQLSQRLNVAAQDCQRHVTFESDFADVATTHHTVARL